MIALSLIAPSTTFSAPEIKRQRLAKGQQAPFAGNLLSDAALAKLITDAETKLKRSELLRERSERERRLGAATAEAVCNARLVEWKAKEEACREHTAKTNSVLRDAVKRCETPWYRSPVFSFIAGQVIAGGICVGASKGL